MKKSTQLTALSLIALTGTTLTPGTAQADTITPPSSPELDAQTSKNADEKKIDAAAQRLAKAQEKLDEATTLLNDAQEAQENTQTALAQARQELAKHENDLTEARENLATQEELARTAPEKLEAAKADVADKEKRTEEAAARAAEAETAATAAASTLESAQKTEAATQAEANTTRAALIEAQNKLATTQQAIKSQQNVVDALSGSQSTANKPAHAAGFFAHNGADEAASIINGTHADTPDWYSQYVHVGDTSDSSSLDNMLAALDIIDATNTKRAQEGLAPLKVTHKLMAIAQVRAEYGASATNHADDLLRYNLNSAAENLAFGYGASAASQAWYDEKNIEDENARGHYNNMTNASYALTGAAYNTENGANSWGNTAGQMYSADTGETAYTVAEYRTLLQEYAEQASVAGEVTVNDQTLPEAESILAQLKSDEELAKHDLARAQKAHDDASAQNAKAKVEREAAQQAHTSTQEVLTQAQSVLAHAAQELATAQHVLDTLTHASAHVETAKLAVTHIEKLITDTRTVISALEKELVTLQDKATAAQNTVRQARLDAQEAQSELENLRATVADTEKEDEEAGDTAVKGANITFGSRDLLSLNPTWKVPAFDTTPNADTLNTQTQSQQTVTPRTLSQTGQAVGDIAILAAFATGVGIMARRRGKHHLS